MTTRKAKRTIEGEDESEDESEYESENESPHLLLREESKNCTSQGKCNSCYAHALSKLMTRFIKVTTNLFTSLSKDGRENDCDVFFEPTTSNNLLEFIEAIHSSQIKCDENTIVTALLYRIFYRIIMTHDTNQGGTFDESIKRILYYCSHLDWYTFYLFWLSENIFDREENYDKSEFVLVEKYKHYLTIVYNSLYSIKTLAEGDNIVMIYYNQEELWDKKNIEFLKKIINLGLYAFLTLNPLSDRDEIGDVSEFVHIGGDDSDGEEEIIDSGFVHEVDDGEEEIIDSGSIHDSEDSEGIDQSLCHAVTITRVARLGNGFVVKNSWGRGNDQYGNVIVDGFLNSTVFDMTNNLNKYIIGVEIILTRDQYLTLMTPKTKKRRKH